MCSTLNSKRKKEKRKKRGGYSQCTVHSIITKVPFSFSASLHFFPRRTFREIACIPKTFSKSHFQSSVTCLVLSFVSPCTHLPVLFMHFGFACLQSVIRLHNVNLSVYALCLSMAVMETSTFFICYTKVPCERQF